MQTTLRIEDETYREAKAEAARRGVTLTKYIEEALRAWKGGAARSQNQSAAEERNELMEALLKRTAHFKIGERPTRDEMNER